MQQRLSHVSRCGDISHQSGKLSTSARRLGILGLAEYELAEKE